MFYCVNSSVADITCGVLLDVMVEATLKAKNHCFQYILFLGTSRHLVHLFQYRKTTNWLQQIKLADLDFLNPKKKKKKFYKDYLNHLNFLEEMRSNFILQNKWA